MKKRLIAGLLLAGSTMFAGPRFSIGVGFGTPVVAPPVVAAAPAYGPAYIPPCPGPDYNWVAGYYGVGGAWVPGYWNYVAPVAVAPGFGFRADFGHGRDFDHRGGFVRNDVRRAPVAARGNEHGGARGRR